MNMYLTQRSHAAGAVRRSRRGLALGLSLVETMISLTITSTLLVAVAATYNASASAVDSNQGFFKATQAARITMNQMLAEIRQAESVKVYSDHIDIIRPLSMLTPDPADPTNPGMNEVSRRFQWDSTGQRITLQIFYGPNSVGGQVYELAGAVTSATFGPAVIGKDWNNTPVVQHVPIVLIINVAHQYVNLSGSAGPQRAQASF